MERSKAGAKERSANGLTIPNQTKIIIIIIIHHNVVIYKILKKFKQIQLTKKQNGLESKNDKSSTLSRWKEVKRAHSKEDRTAYHYLIKIQYK